ncbi:MAG: hypothetical protein F4X64_06780 [Chloroflexi bacterium]|nr:hypothetical protein [Chloroflexota bacterium]
MTQANSRSRRRAERHYTRAVSYRDDANLLLIQYHKSDSAGALMYEAAKQCINAVANLNGLNPGSTGAKRRYLESVAARPSNSLLNLEKGWQAVSLLHIHADRGHLNSSEFRAAWLLAQDFVDDMLVIYAGGG